MTTQTQWNTSAEWYDQNMGAEGDHLNANIIKPELLSLLGDLDGRQVLDAGCGSGYLTSELANKAKSVVGTDFAPDFVELCQQKYSQRENLQFQQQDVTVPLDFENDSFDIVLSKMVLQYVPEIKTFANECFRVLKTSGHLVLVVDHPFHSQFFYAQSLAGKVNPKYEGIENYFSHQAHTKLSLWGKVELTWYPRTVSDYIKPFIDAGFGLETISELGETKDGVTVPRVLMVRFVKRK